MSALSSLLSVKVLTKHGKKKQKLLNYGSTKCLWQILDVSSVLPVIVKIENAALERKYALWKKDWRHLMFSNDGLIWLIWLRYFKSLRASVMMIVTHRNMRLKRLFQHHFSGILRCTRLIKTYILLHTVTLTIHPNENAIKIAIILKKINENQPV